MSDWRFGAYGTQKIEMAFEKVIAAFEKVEMAFEKVIAPFEKVGMAFKKAEAFFGARRPAEFCIAAPSNA